MTPLVEIHLPGPPRGKGRPSTFGKRRFKDAKTDRFEQRLKWAARLAMGAQLPFMGQLEVHVLARFPVPASWPKRRRAAALAHEILPTGKPDVDNILKTIDGLNEVVWDDDARVVRAVVEKIYHPEPALVIRVGRALEWLS